MRTVVVRVSGKQDDALVHVWWTEGPRRGSWLPHFRAGATEDSMGLVGLAYFFGGIISAMQYKYSQGISCVSS